MLWMLLAGGMAVASYNTNTSMYTITDVKLPVVMNHTLLGEEIPADQVVCRNRWGTPMLPDGKGGYSLIAPINEAFIAQSLIIPPITGGPVYRPLPAEEIVVTTVE